MTIKEKKLKDTNPIKLGSRPKSGKRSNRRRSSSDIMSIKTGKNILNGLTRHQIRNNLRTTMPSGFGEKSLTIVNHVLKLAKMKTLVNFFLILLKNSVYIGMPLAST